MVLRDHNLNAWCEPSWAEEVKVVEQSHQLNGVPPLEPSWYIFLVGYWVIPGATISGGSR